MGLDMNLSRRHYIRNWDFMKPEQKHKITITKGGEPVDFDVNKVSEVIEHVAYWRKANQIHSWFVENVQKGVDDCGEYYVDHDKLQELVDLCKTVLEQTKLVDGKVVNGQRFTDNGWEDIVQPGKVVDKPEIAGELLPTASGFFFGGTDYDEYYYQDLRDTVEAIEPLLEKDENGNYKNSGDFYYTSSW